MPSSNLIWSASAVRRYSSKPRVWASTAEPVAVRAPKRLFSTSTPSPRITPASADQAPADEAEQQPEPDADRDDADAGRRTASPRTVAGLRVNHCSSVVTRRCRALAGLVSRPAYCGVAQVVGGDLVARGEHLGQQLLARSRRARSRPFSRVKVQSLLAGLVDAQVAADGEVDHGRGDVLVVGGGVDQRPESHRDGRPAAA